VIFVFELTKLSPLRSNHNYFTALFSGGPKWIPGSQINRHVHTLISFLSHLSSFSTLIENYNLERYINENVVCITLYKTDSSMAGLRKGRLTRSFSDSFHSSEKFVRSCMVVRKMNFTHWKIFTTTFLSHPLRK
jgi:hypothetical protein